MKERLSGEAHMLRWAESRSCDWFHAFFGKPNQDLAGEGWLLSISVSWDTPRMGLELGYL